MNATAITLQAPGVAVAVDPDHGGRLTRLTNLHDGREWLHQARATRTPATSYDEGDLGGWDEMLPTIAACRHPETGDPLRDHGDLWDQPWEVTSCDDHSVVTRVSTRGPMVVLERSIRVLENHVRLDYAATSERDVAVLWAAHPLFSTRVGSRVVLDESMRPWRAGDAARSPYPWPREGLSVERDVPTGTDLKLFGDVTRCAGASCAIVDADGSRVDLRWDVRAAPFVGLWLDHGHLVEGAVAALEPTTGADDALDVANRLGPAFTLWAHRPRRWWLDVRLSAANHAPVAG